MFQFKVWIIGFICFLETFLGVPERINAISLNRNEEKFLTNNDGTNNAWLDEEDVEDITSLVLNNTDDRNRNERNNNNNDSVSYILNSLLFKQKYVDDISQFARKVIVGESDVKKANEKYDNAIQEKTIDENILISNYNKYWKKVLMEPKTIEPQDMDSYISKNIEEDKKSLTELERLYFGVNDSARERYLDGLFKYVKEHRNSKEETKILDKRRKKTNPKVKVFPPMLNIASYYKKNADIDLSESEDQVFNLISTTDKDTQDGASVPEESKLVIPTDTRILSVEGAPVKLASTTDTNILSVYRPPVRKESKLATTTDTNILSVEGAPVPRKSKFVTTTDTNILRVGGAPVHRGSKLSTTTDTNILSVGGAPVHRGSKLATTTDTSILNVNREPVPKESNWVTSTDTNILSIYREPVPNEPKSAITTDTSILNVIREPVPKESNWMTVTDTNILSIDRGQVPKESNWVTSTNTNILNIVPVPNEHKFAITTDTSILNVNREPVPNELNWVTSKDTNILSVDGEPGPKESNWMTSTDINILSRNGESEPNEPKFAIATDTNILSSGPLSERLKPNKVNWAHLYPVRQNQLVFQKDYASKPKSFSVGEIFSTTPNYNTDYMYDSVHAMKIPNDDLNELKPKKITNLENNALKIIENDKLLNDNDIDSSDINQSTDMSMGEDPMDSENEKLIRYEEPLSKTTNTESYVTEVQIIPGREDNISRIYASNLPIQSTTEIDPFRRHMIPLSLLKEFGQNKIIGRPQTDLFSPTLVPFRTNMIPITSIGQSNISNFESWYLNLDKNSRNSFINILRDYFLNKNEIIPKEFSLNDFMGVPTSTDINIAHLKGNLSRPMQAGSLLNEPDDDIAAYDQVGISASTERNILKYNNSVNIDTETHRPIPEISFLRKNNEDFSVFDRPSSTEIIVPEYYNSTPNGEYSQIKNTEGKLTNMEDYLYKLRNISKEDFLNAHDDEFLVFDHVGNPTSTEISFTKNNNYENIDSEVNHYQATQTASLLNSHNQKFTLFDHVNNISVSSERNIPNYSKPKLYSDNDDYAVFEHDIPETTERNLLRYNDAVVKDSKLGIYRPTQAIVNINSADSSLKDVSHLKPSTVEDAAKKGDFREEFLNTQNNGFSVFDDKSSASTERNVPEYSSAITLSQLNNYRPTQATALIKTSKSYYKQKYAKVNYVKTGEPSNVEDTTKQGYLQKYLYNKHNDDFAVFGAGINASTARNILEYNNSIMTNSEQIRYRPILPTSLINTNKHYNHEKHTKLNDAKSDKLANIELKIKQENLKKAFLNAHKNDFSVFKGEGSALTERNIPKYNNDVDTDSQLDIYRPTQATSLINTDIYGQKNTSKFNNAKIKPQYVEVTTKEKNELKYLKTHHNNLEVYADRNMSTESNIPKYNDSVNIDSKHIFYQSTQATPLLTTHKMYYSQKHKNLYLSKSKPVNVGDITKQEYSQKEFLNTNKNDFAIFDNAKIPARTERIKPISYKPIQAMHNDEYSHKYMGKLNYSEGKTKQEFLNANNEGFTVFDNDKIPARTERIKPISYRPIQHNNKYSEKYTSKLNLPKGKPSNFKDITKQEFLNAHNDGFAVFDNVKIPARTERIKPISYRPIQQNDKNSEKYTSKLNLPKGKPSNFKDITKQEFLNAHNDGFSVFDNAIFPARTERIKPISYQSKKPMYNDEYSQHNTDKQNFAKGKPSTFKDLSKLEYFKKLFLNTHNDDFAVFNKSEINSSTEGYIPKYNKSIAQSESLNIEVTTTHEYLQKEVYLKTHNNKSAVLNRTETPAATERYAPKYIDFVNIDPKPNLYRPTLPATLLRPHGKNMQKLTTVFDRVKGPSLTEGKNDKYNNSKNIGSKHNIYRPSKPRIFLKDNVEDKKKPHKLSQKDKQALSNIKNWWNILYKNKPEDVQRDFFNFNYDDINNTEVFGDVKFPVSTERNIPKFNHSVQLSEKHSKLIPTRIPPSNAEDWRIIALKNSQEEIKNNFFNTDNNKFAVFDRVKIPTTTTGNIPKYNKMLNAVHHTTKPFSNYNIDNRQKDIPSHEDRKYLSKPITDGRFLVGSLRNATTSIDTNYRTLNKFKKPQAVQADKVEKHVITTPYPKRISTTETHFLNIYPDSDNISYNSHKEQDIAYLQKVHEEHENYLRDIIKSIRRNEWKISVLKKLLESDFYNQNTKFDSTMVNKDLRNGINNNKKLYINPDIVDINNNYSKNETDFSKMYPNLEHKRNNQGIMYLQKANEKQAHHLRQIIEDIKKNKWKLNMFKKILSSGLLNSNDDIEISTARSLYLKNKNDYDEVERLHDPDKEFKIFTNNTSNVYNNNTPIGQNHSFHVQHNKELNMVNAEENGDANALINNENPFITETNTQATAQYPTIEKPPVQGGTVFYNEADNKSFDIRSSFVCGKDRTQRSTSDEVEEGIDNIQWYPWLGLLYYYQEIIPMTANVVLVKMDIAIALTTDIKRYPKRDFTSRAVVCFAGACPEDGVHLRTYSAYGGREKEPVVSIVMLQLEIIRKPEVVPICSPPDVFTTSKVYAMVPGPRFRMVQIYEMVHVGDSACRAEYSTPLSSVIWPRHWVCARAANMGNHSCDLPSGALLVVKQGTQWHLMGISMGGPGCSATSRYLDYGQYRGWVERTLKRVGRAAITRVAPNQVIMRKVWTHIQRFGLCEPTEMENEIYTDYMDYKAVQNMNGTFKYNLTITARYEYSCVIFKADYHKGGLIVPQVSLQYYCTLSHPLCYEPSAYKLDFYVEVEFEETFYLSLAAYGKRSVLVDPRLLTRFMNLVEERPVIPVPGFE